VLSAPLSLHAERAYKIIDALMDSADVE